MRPRSKNEELANQIANKIAYLRRIKFLLSSSQQLDPAEVAPIDYSSLKVSSNNGTEAVIAINKGPIKTVYLKRLIRQDQSDI